MRVLRSLILLPACIASVQGQGALTSLAKQLPNCSLSCFMQEIPESSCATNLTSACLCSNTALNTAVEICAQKTCTVYELLQTKNVSTTSCGAPVRDKGEKFHIVVMTGIAVAVVSFIARLAASLGKRGRKLSWDDATMAIVVVLAIPPAVFAPILVQDGLGRDIWTLKAEQITDFLRFFFCGEIFYVSALGFSKISILSFYLRVFPSRAFRNLTFAVMGLSVAYIIATVFVTIFQCTPVSLAWTQWDGLHQGRCNNMHIQGWVAAAVNIVLDIVVMVLPLKHLAGLQMNLTKKIMVLSMFSVGIFVIVVSIMRLESLIHFANTTNLTWDYVETGYWSLIEIDVSIVCGNMPAHRLLLAKAWPRISSTLHSSKGLSNLSNSGFLSKDGNHQSSARGPGKGTQTKVKPTTGDEGDFVPLVDLENNRSMASSTNDEKKSSNGWIIRNSSVELTGLPVTSAGCDTPARSTGKQPTTGKEHF